MPIRQPQSYTIGNKSSGTGYHMDSLQQKSGAITVEKINDSRYHEIERKNSGPGYMESLRGHIPMQQNQAAIQGYQQSRPTQQPLQQQQQNSTQQNSAHNIFPRFRC